MAAVSLSVTGGGEFRLLCPGYSFLMLIRPCTPFSYALLVLGTVMSGCLCSHCSLKMLVSVPGGGDDEVGCHSQLWWPEQSSLRLGLTVHSKGSTAGQVS